MPGAATGVQDDGGASLSLSLVLCARARVWWWWAQRGLPSKPGGATLSSVSARRHVEEGPIGKLVSPHLGHNT